MFVIFLIHSFLFFFSKTLDEDGVEVLERNEIPKFKHPAHITLAQGLSRSEKMDLIIEKATELGNLTQKNPHLQETNTMMFNQQKLSLPFFLTILSIQVFLELFLFQRTSQLQEQINWMMIDFLGKKITGNKKFWLLANNVVKILYQR